VHPLRASSLSVKTITEGSRPSSGYGKLMIETDSPYLAPEPKRGKVNEPAFLRHLGQFAAKLFDVTEDFLAERTFEKTCDFYEV